MEYLYYLKVFINFFPTLLFLFAFLTLVPKSVKKVKTFAKENFEEYRFHRCYGLECCCQIYEKDSPEVVLRRANDKPRKVVRRVYQKGQALLNKTNKESLENDTGDIKRQVEPSTIQTQTNVNQIARMFESGASANHSTSSVTTRKVHRVQPTHIQVPEIRVQNDEKEQRLLAVWNNYNNKKSNQSNSQNNNKNINNNNIKQINTKLNQWLQQENSEKSFTSLNSESNQCSNNELPVMKENDFIFGSDSSTSSTASPGASSSPISTPPLSPSMHQSTISSLDPAKSSSSICIMNSSMEDLFAAIAKSAEQNDVFFYSGLKTLSPVTSIDDILSQRRLSRPLSAYSISDLLNEEPTPAPEETFC